LGRRANLVKRAEALLDFIYFPAVSHDKCCVFLAETSSLCIVRAAVTDAPLLTSREGRALNMPSLNFPAENFQMAKKICASMPN
jgi:hypothetical protein